MALQRGHIVAQQPEVSDIRELTREDLAHLTVKREPVTIQTLRDNHHRIARCLASGMGVDDTAAICGMSYNRVSMLKADPSVKELIAHYRGLITADWIREQDHLASVARANMLKAEAMLSDKIDAALENNEFLPTRDLIAIAGDRMDRFGYGKVQKNININSDFAAKLEAARNRSSRVDEARVIEAEPASFRRL
jgi:hypothetical protein